jgi:DNA-binding GntR family transcriptional regulator
MSDTRVVRTIREQVVDRLRADVMSGRIGAGVSLREAELAERFGTSRGPIRDALLQLTQEGLLVSRPNCGVRVGCPPDGALSPLLFELRRKVETHALGRIMGGLTAADDAELDAILRRFGIACAIGEMPAVVEHDMAMHRWIVERTGDPDQVAIWLAITVRMRLMYTRHRALMESFREHEAVVEAVRRRDLEAACGALVANIRPHPRFEGREQDEGGTDATVA